MKSSHLHTTSPECHPRQESPCLRLHTLFLYLQPSRVDEKSSVHSLLSFEKPRSMQFLPPSCPELPSGTDIDFFSWSMWVQVDWATSVHILWHKGWSRVNLEEIVSRTCLLGGHGGWGKEKAGLWCGWFSTAFQVILRFCQGSMLAGKKMLFLLNWVLAWFPTLKSR